MRYLIEAIVSLGVLVIAPLVLEPPDELWEQVVWGVVALILAGVAFRSIVGFVNSRRPRHFPDSVLAPRQPPKKE